jgi:hypothetical protein
MLNRSTLPLVHAAQLSVLNDSYAGHAAPDAADSPFRSSRQADRMSDAWVAFRQDGA